MDTPIKQVEPDPPSLIDEVIKALESARKTDTNFISRHVRLRNLQPIPESQPIDITDSIQDYYHSSKQTMIHDNPEIVYVHPDTRYVVNLLQASILKDPKQIVETKSEYITMFSLLSDYLHRYYQYILYCDATSDNASVHAIETCYDNNSTSLNVNYLADIKLPDTLFILCSHFRPYKNSFKTPYAFVPSMSTTQWIHDYGRTILPYIFLIAHNYVTKLPEYDNMDLLMLSFYNEELIILPDRTLTVGNFINGYSKFENKYIALCTWMNSVIIDIFDYYEEVPDKYLQSLVPVPLNEYLPLKVTCNPYQTLLAQDNIDELNFTIMKHEIECYITSNSSDDQTIKSCLLSSNANVIPIATHTCLDFPTWHAQPPLIPEDLEKFDPAYISTQSYVSKLGYETGQNDGTKKNVYKPPALLHMSTRICNPLAKTLNELKKPFKEWPSRLPFTTYYTFYDCATESITTREEKEINMALNLGLFIVYDEKYELNWTRDPDYVSNSYVYTHSIDVEHIDPYLPNITDNQSLSSKAVPTTDEFTALIEAPERIYASSENKIRLWSAFRTELRQHSTDHKVRFLFHLMDIQPHKIKFIDVYHPYVMSTRNLCSRALP